MDDGRIVLIGNETDVLHCGYSHSISDSGKRYPSAVHYTHSMILSQLGVDENVILELLCTSSCDVPLKARELLTNNMPAGHDLNTLAGYLQSSKQSYTMVGLRLRVQQDKVFEKSLMDTNDALLIVCDKRDRELGIGMDETQFVEWMQREHADYRQLTYWMRNENQRPVALGVNQLGFYLMWLRYEVRQQRRTALLMRPPQEVDGLSMDNEDKPMKMKISDLVISLQGIFRPLSNYYPLHFNMKGERYRSVEHFAYEKLFDSLKLDDKQIEKIQTTVNPCDVPLVAERVFKKLELKPETVENKMSKMDRWRQSAMKHKVSQHNYLQQLLLSTGDAIIIDCSDGEPMWTCGSSEAELQHLLTKSYVTPTTLINWMREPKDGKLGKSVAHLRGNKTGLLLMELRGKLASSTQDRMPLVSALSPPFNITPSPHMVCFTAESVWHPLYSAEIRAAPDQPLIPSPAHYVAQQALRYLSLNKEDTDYVMEPRSSLECWERLHEIIELRGRELEREQSWWMERRQKVIKDALQLLFEQHPPLLRALLDTGDALLVYCSRFCSMETEMSIGMRESDLRTWLKAVDVSTAQLLELCTRPMAFRPSYLGGNRLGLILMQLRRDFCLRGVYPQTLPELSLSPENILGTDSPIENMMVAEKFDIMNPENYTSLWINPLFLLAKEKGDSELLAAASQVKLAPRLVTIDETKISEIIDSIDLLAGKPDEVALLQVEPEDLRAVFTRLSLRLRQKMGEVDRQQMTMNQLSVDVSRLQMIRRGLEETRDRTMGVQERAAGGKEREEGVVLPSARPDREGRERSPPKRIIEREYKVPVRRPRSPSDRERMLPKRDLPDRRGRSPMVPHHPRRNDYQERERTSVHQNGSSPQRKREKAPTPPPQPKPPKIPRPADAELSDGEILSSDED